MGSGRAYTVGELAEMAGVSTRMLRHYDEEGLLSPRRLPNGYRSYTEGDVKRLAGILAMRSCGLSYAEIKAIVSGEGSPSSVLSSHLSDLRTQERELHEAIDRTKAAIARIERIEAMEAEKAFENLKNQAVKESEEAFGKEARERYGDDVVDKTNDRLLGLSCEEWNEKDDLEKAVLRQLIRAMESGAVDSPEAVELVRMHRRWVGIHWGCDPEPEAYNGLAMGYLADERFMRYYDDACGSGATEFLVGAIQAAN